MYPWAGEFINQRKQRCETGEEKLVRKRRINNQPIFFFSPTFFLLFQKKVALRFLHFSSPLCYGAYRTSQIQLGTNKSTSVKLSPKVWMCWTCGERAAWPLCPVHCLSCPWQQTLLSHRELWMRCSFEAACKLYMKKVLKRAFNIISNVQC